jgi:hypothetical protein
MTTIVDILNRAGRQCSLTNPSNWVSATAAGHLELRDDFLLETVDELHKRIDWPSPIGKQQVIAGTGAENYALNSDFIRLTFDEFAIYETQNVRRIGAPIAYDGAWTHLKDIGTAGGARYFRLKGYEGNFTIDFFKEPATGETITVSYISNLWMVNSGGTKGKAFTDVADVSLFPRRLLELGIVWRFRKRKGLRYDAIRAEYEAHIATEANRTKSIRKINFGTTSEESKPMRHPIPDFIPSS